MQVQESHQRTESFATPQSYRFAAWYVLAAVLVGLVFAGKAEAATMTFNDTATLTTPFNAGNSPYVEAGFQATFNDTGSMTFIDKSFSLDLSSFDDDVLGWERFASATFTQVGGGPFDAISFFGGELVSDPGSLEFVGNVHGGGTVTQSFTFPKGTHAQYTLVGFGNLDSLVVIHPGTLFKSPVIDDLVFESDGNPTPEPSTLALATVGLLFLGLVRRRRR